MTDSIRTNEQPCEPNASAFAVPDNMTNDGYLVSGWRGLTKREYFAAVALQGILSNPSIQQTDHSVAADVCLSRAAIGFADSLINELNKVQP